MPFAAFSNSSLDIIKRINATIERIKPIKKTIEKIPTIVQTIEKIKYRRLNAIIDPINTKAEEIIREIV